MKIEEKCINTIRCLAIDAVEKANSGHPGMPMALAPSAYTLWMNHIHYNPANPKWFNRDRFVLAEALIARDGRTWIVMPLENDDKK